MIYIWEIVVKLAQNCKSQAGLCHKSLASKYCSGRPGFKSRQIPIYFFISQSNKKRPKASKSTAKHPVGKIPLRNQNKLTSLQFCDWNSDSWSWFYWPKSKYDQTDDNMGMGRSCWPCSYVCRRARCAYLLLERSSRIGHTGKLLSCFWFSRVWHLYDPASYCDNEKDIFHCKQG